MTNDTRTPEEIERDIERERAALTDTIEDLQDKFSIETMARQFTDHLRENGSDIGRSVSQSVKDNPMAVALTGVGLAWLIFGGGSGSSRNDRQDRYEDDRPSYRFASERPHSSLTHRSVEDRWSTGSSEPAWMRSSDEMHDGDRGSVAGLTHESSYGRAGADSSSGSGIADKAKQTKEKVAETAQSLTDTASSTAASAKETVSGAANRTTDRAAALRERLSEGTEDFSEEARARVVAARERAVEARQSAARYARQGQQRAADLFEEQPLVAGAVAFTVGAAVAASLPKTRMEDDYLGDHSDVAISEAERIFQEEKEKLTQVAKAAGDKAKEVAEDLKDEADSQSTSKSATKAAKDEAKKAGKRVADAAKTEANEQDLGKLKT